MADWNFDNAQARAEDTLEEIRYENGVWKAKDGKCYLIQDMTTKHIQNAIRLIKKSKFEWRSEWYVLLKNELKRREIR